MKNKPLTENVGSQSQLELMNSLEKKFKKHRI